MEPERAPRGVVPGRRRTRAGGPRPRVGSSAHLDRAGLVAHPHRVVVAGDRPGHRVAQHHDQADVGHRRPQPGRHRRVAQVERRGLAGDAPPGAGGDPVERRPAGEPGPVARERRRRAVEVVHLLAERPGPPTGAPRAGRRATTSPPSAAPITTKSGRARSRGSTRAAASRTPRQARSAWCAIRRPTDRRRGRAHRYPPAPCACRLALDPCVLVCAFGAPRRGGATPRR